MKGPVGSRESRRRQVTVPATQQRDPAVPPVRARTDDVGEGVTSVDEAGPERVPNDEMVRRAAQMEEMVARTHERAAQLYETWSGQRGEARSHQLGQRAQVHRDAAAAVRSVDRLAERTVQSFETRVESGSSRPGKGRCLAALAALNHLRELVSRRIEEKVKVGRREGATWTEIATALRVTRQTAHQRYRDQP